jgi:hypothetical protein
MDDEFLNVTINELGLEMDPFMLHFDGISDTSDVISRLLTFSGNVIRDRLVSMSHYEPAVGKLQNLMNTLLELIPDIIPIPGTDLELEGGISNKLKIVEDDYMKLPLDVSLQNSKYNYTKSNTCDFGEYVQSEYQIQSFISEYVLDSGMWALYKGGYFKASNISVPVITTTEIDIALLGKLSRNGFKHGQPCVVDMSVINNSPDIEITKAKGLHFTGQLAFDLRCKRAEAEENFSQLFTINTTPIEFEGKVLISKQLTISVKITELHLNIQNVTDSTVGDVSLTLFKALFTLTEPIFKGLINLIMGRGINFEWILEKLGIDFIVFEQTLLEP